MTFRQLMLLPAAAIVILVIAGCNGPAPTLDQSVALTVNASPQPPTNIPCGSSLALAAAVTSPSSSSTNPVTSVNWSQTSTPPGNTGSFLVNSSDSLANTWVAPQTIQSPAGSPAATQASVTLTCSVKTLLGGQGSTTINITVTPQSSLPVYHFLDITNGVVSPHVFYDPAGTLPFKNILDQTIGDEPGTTNPGPAESALYIRGVVYIYGQPATAAQLATLSFAWTDAVTGNKYEFDHPDQVNPVWTAPTLPVITQPDSSISVYNPQTYYLQVVTTYQGISSYSYLVVPVVDHDNPSGTPRRTRVRPLSWLP